MSSTPTKVAGNLVVRRARDGEKVLALDGREYALTPEMCVIADDNGVESIAGIMGGEHSGCDENTTDVLIESALWEPLNIARTGRDARHHHRCALPLRARRRSGIHGAGPRAGDARWCSISAAATPSETEVVGYAGHTPKIVVLPASGGEAPDRPRRAGGREPRHPDAARLRAARRSAMSSTSRCRPGGRMSTARPTSSRRSCASTASTTSRRSRSPATTRSTARS